MTIQHRALSSVATGTGSSITITKPAGIQEGDYLHAVMGLADADGYSITLPSGWITIRGTPGGNNQEIGFSKIATDSEPADYTFDIGVSTDYVAAINAWYSDTGRTIECVDDVPKAWSYTIASVTFTSPNGGIRSMLLVCAGDQSPEANWGGVTEHFEDGDRSGDGGTVWHGSDVISSSGATSEETLDGVSTSSSTTLTFALQEPLGNIYTSGVRLG